MVLRGDDHGGREELGVSALTGERRRKTIRHDGGVEFTLHMPTWGEMKNLEDDTQILECKSDVDRAVDKMASLTDDSWKIKVLDDGHDAVMRLQESATEYQLRKIEWVARLGREGALALDNDVFYWLLGEIDTFRMGVVADVPSKLGISTDATSAPTSASASTPPASETTLTSDASTSNSIPVGPARPGSNEWLSRRMSLVSSP